MNFKLDGTQVVTVEIIRNNFHGTVIAPNVGIAAFIANGVQLVQRLLFGYGTHPIELLNTQSHRVFNASGHLHRGSFQFGGKGFSNVGLSQSFSEIAINVLDTALPSRLLLFGAAQILAIEIEI